ncbi:MAG: AIM24 family protein [Mycobacterium sp.]|nr:AIM24 family protein [Mycobacterium sp.]
MRPDHEIGNGSARLTYAGISKCLLSIFNEECAVNQPNPGSWQPDPEGRFEFRWWDGQTWTDQVSTRGQVFQAPLGGPPAQPQSAQAPSGPAHATPEPTPAGDGFAGISGDLVDGRFSEKEATPIANQNAKMFRVRLGEPFMARQGAMVAYQGNVDFAYEGSGASKFIKKAFTGEGLPLMRCQGQGDVFLADRAYDIHLLKLSNSGLSVSGKNVLAFSSSLDWNVERVKGGSIATGGLFNTTLRGTGWVALTTDGPPVVLNAGEAPTFADTNAVVAWSANLQTSLKASFKAGALIGRGSGEALQVAFAGQGFVIVQPSEGVTIPVQ